MNESGPPLTALVRTLGIPPDRLLILQDEMDLPLGRIQLKRGGSAAGHRGIESLYQTLGSTDFYRLRIGIGRPDRGARDYVLSEFSPEEMKSLDSAFDSAMDGLEIWIGGDPPKALQKLNS